MGTTHSGTFHRSSSTQRREDRVHPQQSRAQNHSRSEGTKMNTSLRPMTAADWELVGRLSRRVDAQSFATVLKACLIVKTRAAAMKADKELKGRQGGLGLLRRRTSRVALPGSEASDREPVQFLRLLSSRLQPRHIANTASEACSTGCMRDAVTYRNGDPTPTSKRVGIVSPYEAASVSLGMQQSLLDQRLSFLGCRSVTAAGDGNCQFRACSWNLFGSEDRHKVVRQRAVDHIRATRCEYEVFFETEASFERYLRQMARSGTWGDEITLRAIADSFVCTIHIITSVESNWYLRYDPQKDGQPVQSKRHVFLAYISPIHYNAFYLRETNDTSC